MTIHCAWLATFCLLATPTLGAAQGQAEKSAAPWDARAVEHLLNRAGFGATAIEVEETLAKGRATALQELFLGRPVDAPRFVIRETDLPTPEERRAMSEEERRKAQQRVRREDGAQLLEYSAWWFDAMTGDHHPLRERMVLFWHGFFTSSAREVKNGEAMIRQNQLFREHALGSYAELLRAIVRDPAMLVYLNNNRNTRAAPNENLARELMELFSLGEGNYTESDVKEAARALTGYTQIDGQFFFNRRQHDAGSKTVLGVTGALDADQLVDILLAQEACPRWVAGKLLEHFEGRTPPAERVEKYAKFLRASDFRVDAFLKKLFDDPEFYSPGVVGQRIVGPIEFLVANCRRLDVHPPGNVIAAGASLLGQQAFGPPSVKGWDGGRTWITTSTFLQRGNLAGMLLGVTRVEDIFKEDPAMLMDEEEEGGEMAGGDEGEPMEPKPAKPEGRARRPEGKPEIGGGRGVAAGLRRMESARWRTELDLRERCLAKEALTDAAIVDRLGSDLLAVELTPEGRAALLEYIQGKRASLGVEDGQLLSKKGYGESTLRELAHLVLSLPEAQLN